MKIGIDAGALSGDKPFNSGNYYLALNILKKLNKNYNNYNDYKLYSYEPISNKILKELGPKFTNVVVGPKRFWMMIGMPLELLKNPVDLFVGFNQCLPLFFKGKAIVFILDLAFKKYPHLFVNNNKMSLMTTLVIKKANKIVAISEATKKDIVKYYGSAKKKIMVIYPGI